MRDKQWIKQFRKAVSILLIHYINVYMYWCEKSAKTGASDDNQSFWNCKIMSSILKTGVK